MPVCLLALVALSVWRLRPQAKPATLSLSGECMGTTYAVLLPGVVGSRPELSEAIASELTRIEGQLSTYIESSEVSRFNTSDSIQPFPTSAELHQVLEISQELFVLSGGALDITVRPLVALWGFGAGAQTEPPAESAVLAALARIGTQHLRLSKARDGSGAVVKTSPELQIDLSAVAKGYAVDRVALLLDERGHKNYMVEVGGEVRVSGTKAEQQSFRIGIEKPDSAGRSVQQVVLLRDASLATSGDYRNYYERDGRRVSHTIDPRNGRPISHGLASVSVVHQSAAWADGWATALNVLGPLKGPELANQLGLAALFIVRMRDGGFQTEATASFSQLTTDPQLATP